MPAVLTDYCRRVGGRLAVDLLDGLTAEQMSELLHRPEETVRARTEALQLLQPRERELQGSATALLHAYEATHGMACVLKSLRKGPIPGDMRDRAMIHIYRTLTGDKTSSDSRLATKARIYARLRVGAGATPSAGLRRLFGKSVVMEKQELGRVSGVEKLQVGLTATHFDLGSCVLLSRCPQMDVNNIATGDLLWVKAPGPPDGAARWYKAKVRGFSFRCLMPPILIEFLATDTGDTADHLLPKPKESACRKQMTKPFDVVQQL